MSLSAPELEVLAAVAGLITGVVIIVGAPILAAYRFDDPLPRPPRAVLIPLIGVWLSGWRPLRSVISQVGTAGLFVALALHYGATIQLILACIYSAILIAIAYVDFDYRLVLNRLSYPGTVVCLIGSAFWPHFGLLQAFLGALVALAIMGTVQIIGRGALGAGDTKLAVLIGAMRGLPTVLDALGLGIVIGGLAAAFLWFVMRRGRKEYFAYAPYLGAGAIISLFLFKP